MQSGGSISLPKTVSGMEQALVFLLGNERYALDVVHIQEVLESPRRHYIPRAPAAYLGAINFHGSILPVLDMVTCLGYSGKQRDGRIIVLPGTLCPIALAVTGILGIVSPATGDVSSLQEEDQPDCVKGVVIHDGEPLKLLDVVRLRESLEQWAKSTGGELES